MADGGDESRHNCSICLEDFTKPKILPCVHTFCQHCIDEYIQAHSHGNKFNCPNCRTEIQVPDDGASGFSTNIYIQPKSKAEKHFCRRHTAKEIEFYCRDCSVAVCNNCVLLDHPSHSKTDLTEVDQEFRGKLNIVKGELEGKVEKLEKHCESLNNQISDINNQAKIACDNIDTRVKKVCEEARKHGDDIKCEMIKIRDDDSKKLHTLHDDKIKMKISLQNSLKYVNEVLSGKSTLPVVDALTNVQTRTEHSRSTSLDIPPVRYVHYPLVDIDVTTLHLLLGEMETMESRTWTSSFSLNQVKTGKYYSSEDVIIQGMPWCVSVKHETDTSGLGCNQRFGTVEDTPGLGCYMNLNSVEDTTVKSVTASYTLKLLNINDVSKSIVEQDTASFTPGGARWGRCDVIPWNKLKDVKEGFINNNQIFNVQASVKINKIEHECQLLLADLTW